MGLLRAGPRDICLPRLQLAETTALSRNESQCKKPHYARALAHFVP